MLVLVLYGLLFPGLPIAIYFDWRRFNRLRRLPKDSPKASTPDCTAGFRDPSRPPVNDNARSAPKQP
jgi:hypothetical protein